MKTIDNIRNTDLKTISINFLSRSYFSETSGIFFYIKTQIILLKIVIMRLVVPRFYRYYKNNKILQDYPL